MFSLLFVINFLMIIIIVIYLARKSNIRFLVPTIPSIFLWSYFVFSYVGILALFFLWNDYRVSLGIDNKFKILELWGYSSISILLIVVVFVMLANVFNLKLNTSYSEIKDSGELNRYVKMAMFLLFLLSIGVVLLYLSKIPSIPLIEQLRGASSEELALSRSEATNGFSGNLHWYRLFYSSVLTFLGYYTFAASLKKPSLINWSFFLVTFSAASFTALMTTQKAPLVWFFIGLVSVYLITKKTQIKLKTALILGATTFTALLFMYRRFMGLEGRPIIDVIQSIFSRAFTGQIGPAYFYIEMFPKHEEYLLGRSFPNPGGIFPWENFSITTEVMNFMNPAMIEAGVVGSAPTVFWADMFANFGIGGIILSSLLVGVILYLIQYFINKLDFNPVIIAYCSWLIVEAMTLSSTSLANFLLNIDLVFLTIVVIGMLFLNSQLTLTNPLTWIRSSEQKLLSMRNKT
ncbi:O-antigen polymerase [Metabacillus bambusae]|uniref:Oligosaccharide repeat unit polymerase n=1 Tax=Metabacillus bambusae TaxID=2795218 RepID=A0ABS3N0J3_9BACI|nr:O-antigen polymerase [Metabacillus bambusae]MBO1511770.1 oligosaccharide repeat unit polymerase [Metabacillus bambusae]